MTASDRPRRRKLSDEERAIWRAVTKSVKPLGRKGRHDADDPPDQMPAGVATAAAAPHVSLPAVKSAPAKIQPLADIDRRARQRLSRGTDSIDARLDLHGKTQEQAHASLLRFLRKAQARGDKTVLVITGKGGATDHGRGERGVLQRYVPQWLELPEFRALVVGFGDAGTGHGGAGALYVRVRRAR